MEGGIFICIRIKNNLYLYEDIHNEKEFGMLQVSEKVFNREDIQLICDIEQYCLDYQEELISYYRPVFYRLIKEEVNYVTIRKNFQVKEFLKYRYRTKPYSFDEYFDYYQFGKMCLEDFLWYEFKGSDLIVKEK